MSAGWAKVRSGVKNAPMDLSGRRRAPGECASCHTVALDGICDHIVPRAEGGGEQPANLQWLCRACSDRKTLEESKRGNRRAAERRKGPVV